MSHYSEARRLRTELERDDFSSNRHLTLALCWSMIFFGKPLHTFPDHALGRLLSRPRQRRSALDERPAREIAPAQGRQLSHEVLRIGRQEALRIPADVRPTSNRGAALHQWNCPDPLQGAGRIRGKDCNGVTGSGKRDKGVWRGA